MSSLYFLADVTEQEKKQSEKQKVAHPFGLFSEVSVGEELLQLAFFFSLEESCAGFAQRHHGLPACPTQPNSRWI